MALVSHLITDDKNMHLIIIKVQHVKIKLHKVMLKEALTLKLTN